MTMPHLENCAHTPDGWCLECVKKLGEENIDLRIAILEASRISFMHTFEQGSQNFDEPDIIQVKETDHEQFFLASKLIGEACQKWSI